MESLQFSIVREDVSMIPRACALVLFCAVFAASFSSASDSKPAAPAKKDEHGAKPPAKEAAHGAPAPPAAKKVEHGAKPPAKEAAHGAPAAPAKKDEHDKASALGPVKKDEHAAAPAIKRPIVRLPRPPVRRPTKPAASAAYRVEVHADIYDPPRNAEQALKQLVDGNNRFQSGTPTHPRSTPARMREAARNPSPHTVVLTCADSTIPPELVLDQGIGDIITLRVAGNVSSKDQSASLTYALGQYSPRLLVVLGHTECPVVRSLVNGDRSSPELDLLMAPLREAADKTRYYNPDLRGAEYVDEVARVNVWSTVLGLLRTNQSVSGSMRNGTIKVVGGVVDSQTGKIGWMGEYPARLSSLSPSTGTKFP